MGIRPSTQLSCSLLACVLLFGCSEPGTDSSSAPAAPEPTDGATSVDTSPAEDAIDDGGLLGPGSLAPEVAVQKWMQGEPVEAFKRDTVYVVEFWATWCAPCLRSMPHMSQLQADYGDQVVFMGITSEDEATIAAFLASPGADGKPWSEILGYRIALDDDRATYERYMDAAQQSGIPNAFIVGKTGIVEWFGHPMEMDEPLAKVVDGTWDSTAARNATQAAAKTAKIMDAGMARLSKAAGSGDFAAALKVCDELTKELPDYKELIQIRLTLLLQGKMFDELNTYAAEQVQANQDNAVVLENISWLLATGSKGGELDLDLALKTGLRASEIENGENPSVLDTVAAVYAARGNLDEALAWQKNAVALAPSSPQAAATLSKYEEMRQAAQEAAAPKEEDAAPADDAAKMEAAVKEAANTEEKATVEQAADAVQE